MIISLNVCPSGGSPRALSLLLSQRAASFLVVLHVVRLGNWCESSLMNVAAWLPSNFVGWSRISIELKCSVMRLGVRQASVLMNQRDNKRERLFFWIKFKMNCIRHCTLFTNHPKLNLK